MKRYAIIAAIALASCTGNGDNKTTTTDTAGTSSDTAITAKTPEQEKKYCFVRTEGKANQDTTTIVFTIKGNEVTGQMAWLPKEKDSRKGSLLGTADGDAINAVWSYMQEGVKDSIKVAFKLQPHTLTQKPLKTNTATGRQETDETSGYTIEYKEGDCSAQ